MRRHELLTNLTNIYGYKSYLEIGVQNKSLNFDLVAPGEMLIKVGVDPAPAANASYVMGSDDFFALAPYGPMKFDLIFIDGLHHADQVYKDIINALKILSKKGTIVVHDCKPRSLRAQMVPRVEAVWNGDVWKAWVKLRGEDHGVSMFVLDTDEGCGIIQRGKVELAPHPEKMDYEGLVSSGYKWLKLVPVFDLNSHLNLK